MAVGKTWKYTAAVPSASLGTGYVTFYFEEHYDVATNVSYIHVTRITVTHSRFDGYYYSGKWSVNARIMADGIHVATLRNRQWTGSLVTAGVPAEITGGTLPIVSGAIPHNDSDGTKTVTLTVTIDELLGSDAGWVVRDVSGSQTVALTTIPRASTISATDANIEAASSIVVNRKSSAYTHSIKYQFGSLSGYINVDGSVSNSEVKLDATSIGFTIPTNFYAQIPNSKTGKCTLTVKTYSGSTQIGDAKTCTFTVTAAQAKCAPSVSGTVVDSNDVTKGLTGDENKLVRFFSTALATIEATAKNSASIASKSIAGAEVKESTRTIDAVETDSFVFSATDSRGYSNSAPVVKTLIPYIKLTVNMSVSRDDPTSGKATLIVKGDYFNGSFGAVANTLTVQYRIDSGSWVTVTPALDGNTYSVVAALTGLDYQSIFDFEVKVTDELMSVTKSAMLNKGIPNYHMGENDVTFEVDVNVTGNANIGGALKIGGKTLAEIIAENTDPLRFMPVGYIYKSSDPISPAELFGGTWEQITDRVIVGAGGLYDINSTGGSATHTLTVDEMPAHVHKLHTGGGSVSKDGAIAIRGWSGDSYKYVENTDSRGGGASHNNMQPYIAKYIWERVE